MNLLTECICSSLNPGYTRLGLWDLGQSRHSLIRHAHLFHIHPHNFPSATSRSPQSGNLVRLACVVASRPKWSLSFSTTNLATGSNIFKTREWEYTPWGVNAALISILAHTFNKHTSVALAKTHEFTS